QGGSPGEGNINADPLFVDRKNHDYHLKANSPCQNAGHASVFFNDWDGSRNDMGIFGGSGLYVQPLQLDFGPLGISQEKIAWFTIRNFRDTEVVIQSVSTADNQNFAPITGVPVRIQPMSYQNFEIAFHPQRAGEIISTANVVSPDFKGHNTAVIGLKGRGGVWSGSVSGVWRRVNSPYIIGGTVTVPVDASLTIEPGVVVTIDTMLAGSTARFIVAGTLEAVGTATDSIIFTTVPGQERHGAWEGIDLILSSGSLSNTLPESPAAAMGDWPPDHSVTGMSTSRKDSFELEPTGNQLLVGSANLKYCRVAYARTGILAQSNNITIENCLLQHNREQGLKWYGMENSASGKISHSRIANNGSYGIYCHAYCSDVNGSANPQITFNEIIQNGKAGIYLYAEGGDPSSWTNRTNTARVAPLIENNQVYNNSGFAIDGYAEGDETTGYISIHRSKAYLEPTITRNILAHNQAGLRTKCQLVDPTDRLDFATVIVDRNTFWNHPGVQIAVFDSAKVILKNSILWGGSGVPFTVEGGQVQVSYCDIPVTFPGQGNFSRDPQLVDPANRNFKLSMNSPCIDAGDPTGEKDPDYTIADVGALYYHQSISEFSLQQPAHQAVVRTQSPNLIWNVPATTGGEVLKYELVYSTSADFSQPETITRPDLTQNKYTLANPLADFTQYFWKVKAQNPWGLTRWSKEVFQFTVNTDTLPPTISVNLPRLAFNEDDSLSIPRQFWYEFIEDEKTPDSLLTVNILSGRKIKVFNRNKMVIFKVSKDWFGTDTLQLQVRDAQNLSNSAAFSVQVRSINDPPFFTNLPDSIMLPTESRQTLKIWDYVGDVESSDAQLQYQFATNNNLLNWKFDASTGILTLQSLQVPGRTRLDIMVRDDSSAAVNRAIQIRVAAPSGLSFFENEIPTRYQLYQNFPNPFNPETTIAFSLPAKSNVSIAVFNLKGEKVQTLFEGEQPAGNHLIQWNGQQLASGNYFIKMQAGDFSAITRSILLK
ncbi:right-handed parallel beta-helix repeat-containing protein, partial [candidate division KSB1 bacterium]|nr:right-handed parallel beta-helix repeat-containing protein [candidate division KSB1 bacterium]